MMHFTLESLHDTIDELKRKLAKCRNYGYELEWKNAELLNVVRGVFEEHRLKNIVDKNNRKPL